MKLHIAEPARVAMQSQYDVTIPADAILVDRVRVGDAVAFELIMRRCNRRLNQLARSVLRNGREAEDVVPESYVRAYGKLNNFIGPNGFSTWLCRTALNEALGRRRKHDQVFSFEDYGKGAGAAAYDRRIDVMRAHQPAPERLAADSELRRLLENAIAALPDYFRPVFVLRPAKSMSLAEMPKCLPIAPETVKTRFLRASRRLQDSLGARFDALMPVAFAGQDCDRIVATGFARIGPLLNAPRRHARASAEPHLPNSRNSSLNPNPTQED